MSNKPNILLLTIDCLRADHLGLLDAAGESITPHLDRLAANSCVFRQAITAGGWTRPSLTALLSSTYASMYGGPHTRYARTRPIVTEPLQTTGYRTAGFTTNLQIGRAYGFDRGFDTFVESEPDGARARPRWARLPGMQRLLRQPLTHQLLTPLGLRTNPHEITTPAEHLSAEIYEWVAAPHAQPAFVWAHYMDVHWPYHTLRCPQTPTGLALAWRDLPIIDRMSQSHGHLNPGPAQVDRLRHLYRAAIRYTDEHIGRLIERLQAAGLWDKTALIVTADHGEEFFEHGRWSHYQLFDENIRVPLIVRLPGQAAGQVIDHQVSLVDIVPTVLALAGATPPETMLGQDLVATQRVAPTITEVMWPDTIRLAIRTPEFKYIYDDKQPDAPQLYDLQADPGETRNIYNLHPAVARQFTDLRQAHEERGRLTAATTEAVQVDTDVTDRLKALGYW